MPVFDGDTVRLTRAEHGRLITQARRHGNGHLIPSEIRTADALEGARYDASGATLLEDFIEFAETGSSPATRGERSYDELFGEEVSV